MDRGHNLDATRHDQRGKMPSLEHHDQLNLTTAATSMVYVLVFDEVMPLMPWIEPCYSIRVGFLY